MLTLHPLNPGEILSRLSDCLVWSLFLSFKVLSDMGSKNFHKSHPLPRPPQIMKGSEVAIKVVVGAAPQARLRLQPT